MLALKGRIKTELFRPFRAEDNNYLIPIGANSDLMQDWKQIHVNQIEEWKKELETAAMKTSYVSDMMNASSNQVNLIILDACRNLPTLRANKIPTMMMNLMNHFIL